AALVTLGRGALVFALEHRNVIGAGIPIIFCSVGAPTLEGITLPHDVVGVVSDFDWGKTLQLAAALQPEARDVVIISGASPYDKIWERDALSTLTPHLDKYRTIHLAGLAYGEMLERISRLPRNTIILSVPLFCRWIGSETSSSRGHGRHRQSIFCTGIFAFGNYVWARDRRRIHGQF